MDGSSHFSWRQRGGGGGSVDGSRGGDGGGVCGSSGAGGGGEGHGHGHGGRWSHVHAEAQALADSHHMKGVAAHLMPSDARHQLLSLEGAHHTRRRYSMTAPVLLLIEDYGASGVWGIDVPERLVWEAFVQRRDISRHGSALTGLIPATSVAP